MSLPVKVVVLSVVLAALSSHLLADDLADGLDAAARRDFPTAIDLLTKAIERNPKNTFALWSRGGAFQQIGELDKAIADFDEVIRLKPKHFFAYFSRGGCWFIKGEYDKALSDFDQAIVITPKNVMAYHMRAAVWLAKRNYDKLLADLNELIRLDPTSASTYISRGNVWRIKGDVEKAFTDYDEAIRLNPKRPEAYHGRGSALNSKGEYEKALADFEEAIRLDSESSEALNSRAWLRATCPQKKYRDGAKAIEDATEACELTDWKKPEFLGTLAAACAESGQFDKAIEWQRKAIELAPDDDDLKTRLKLYQEGKPYREEPGKK